MDQMDQTDGPGEEVKRSRPMDRIAADAAKREQADAAKRRAIENFEAFRNNCLIEAELLQVISQGAQDQFV